MDLIEEWKNKRQERKASHKKFVKSLEKSKDKGLNVSANELHEEVFEEIDCLDCANCCSSIPPILNETDIKRAAKFLGMKPAEFKVKYIVFDEDDDIVMNESPCPFLEADNKCAMYDARPKACREYPHTDQYEFLKNIKLHGENSYYCPAVFHILERMNQG